MTTTLHKHAILEELNSVSLFDDDSISKEELEALDDFLVIYQAVQNDLSDKYKGYDLAFLTDLLEDWKINQLTFSGREADTYNFDELMTVIKDINKSGQETVAKLVKSVGEDILEASKKDDFELGQDIRKYSDWLLEEMVEING